MKQKLLRAVEEGRSREAELEALSVDVPANPDGTWNAKDHLAHLAWWRFRAARVLDAARTGGEAPPQVEDDPQNAIVYADNRNRSAADIRADARQSWSRLASAIEASTDDDLLKPHPHAPDRPVWETVPGVDGHLGTHLMFWYLDRHENGPAESAAQWAYRMENETQSEPAQLATAKYNLACFYSRVGRVKDALPLLRASFDARPGLVEWARKDPDLDPIRDHAGFKELLAT